MRDLTVTSYVSDSERHRMYEAGYGDRARGLEPQQWECLDYQAGYVDALVDDLEEKLGGVQ